MTRSEPPAEVIEAVRVAVDCDIPALMGTSFGSSMDGKMFDWNAHRRQHFERVARNAIAAYQKVTGLSIRGEADPSPSLRASSSLGGIEGGAATRPADGPTAPISTVSNGWLSMDSAPKDGTWILGHENPEGISTKYSPIVVMRWRAGTHRVPGWYGDGGHGYQVTDPTRWQPLPSPPNEAVAEVAEAQQGLDGNPAREPPISSPAGALTAEKAAMDDIAAERRRQVETKGWSPEHDDEHSNGEMAMAAVCYALSSADSIISPNTALGALWPWGWEWWKPTKPRRDLVKSAALIVAEIERLDRAAKKSA